jgi:hypothetical protein
VKLVDLFKHFEKVDHHVNRLLRRMERLDREGYPLNEDCELEFRSGDSEFEFSRFYFYIRSQIWLEYAEYGEAKLEFICSEFLRYFKPGSTKNDLSLYRARAVEPHISNGLKDVLTFYLHLRTMETEWRSGHKEALEDGKFRNQTQEDYEAIVEDSQEQARRFMDLGETYSYLMWLLNPYEDHDK